MSNERKLLKEYVRLLLKEESGADALMGDYGMYGAHFASPNDMYNIFVKPFVDVGQTASSELQKTARKARTTLSVFVEALGTVFLPWLESEYTEIFDKEREDLKKIKEKYRSVYESTWDALFDADVALSAFFYNPAAVLTAGFIKEAPVAAVKLASALTGGLLDKLADRVESALTIPRGKHKPDAAFHSKMGPGMGGGGGDWGGGFGEGIIREEKDTDDRSNVANKLEKFLNRPDVRSKIEGSNVSRAMQADAKKMINGTLDKVLRLAAAIKGAQSLDDLKRLGFDPGPARAKMQGVDPQQLKASEAQIVETLKKMATEFLAKNLEAQATLALKNGIAANSEYVNAYRSVISKIRGG
jgi:hypothetical protein